jgi:hypothetical protein
VFFKFRKSSFPRAPLIAAIGENLMAAFLFPVTSCHLPHRTLTLPNQLASRNASSIFPECALRPEAG